jgi:hypothetical protein
LRKSVASRGCWLNESKPKYPLWPRRNIGSENGAERSTSITCGTRSARLRRRHIRYDPGRVRRFQLPWNGAK